jgi:hypothetical protein
LKYDVNVNCGNRREKRYNILRPQFGSGGTDKLHPYKKWAFTLKQKRGTLEGFVNSLRSNRTEAFAKVARFCFVNAPFSRLRSLSVPPLPNCDLMRFGEYCLSSTVPFSQSAYRRHWKTLRGLRSADPP